MKRTNGKGSIYPLPNGRGFKVAISVRMGDGKRKRITRNAKSKTAAVAELRDLLRRYRSGTYLPPTLTVGEFLTKWLDHVRATKAPSTQVLWSSLIDRHIRRGLGSIRLTSLRRADVQSFVDDLVNSKTASRTCQSVFQVLRKAMKHARKLEFITNDPTDLIDKPKHTSKPIRPFAKHEIEAIFAATAGTRWHAPIVLMTTCGFRQGEMWGLEWSAVDFHCRTIDVVQAAAEVRGEVLIGKPKSKAGHRTVELHSFALQALRDHRAILQAEGNGDGKFVFPAPDGGLVCRTNFRSRVWAPLLRQLKLEQRGAHHCRHSYASLALSVGVPIHVVAHVLGHSKPSTTLDCYVHLVPNQQRQATEAMEGLFGVDRNSGIELGPDRVAA